MHPDLPLVINTVRDAGALVMTFFRSAYEIREKGRDNPLTDADIAADSVLRRRLLAERPEYGWLSEETADSPDRLSRKHVWIVDPIDGTKEFIAGVPEFALSVGLVTDGVPVLGVVHNPARNELFAGAAGAGVTLNGRPAALSTPGSMAGARLLASRSEMKRGEFTPFEEDFRIEPVGSIAYKLALVASGGAEATFSLGPKHEWDVCAGVALVLAAGGKATARDGGTLTFNRPVTLTDGIMAAGEPLHRELVRRCGPLLAQFEHRFHERDPR